MNSASSPPADKRALVILAGYFIFTALMLAGYISGAIPSMVPGKFHDYCGFLVFCAVAIAGVFAFQFGAPLGWTLSIGTWGAFIALSLDQEPLVRYLTFAAAIFAIGVYGMVVSRNAVRVLMSIELMLNAVNINFVAFARYVDPGSVKGQVFAIFILTVAAAEAAVGLAIVLSIYRNMATVDMERFNLLKY